MTPDERSEYARRYYADHPELREYHRERMKIRRRHLRQKRQAMASASFTLHDLSCEYPAKGCACRVLIVR